MTPTATPTWPYIDVLVSADTFLSPYSTTVNYAGEEYLVTSSDFLPRYKALLAFDTSEIPSGSEIQGVELRLYGYGAMNAGDLVLGAHEVLTDATVSAASWISRTASSVWGTPGAAGSLDRDPTPISTRQVLSGTTGWTSWDVSPVVAGWIAGTGDNLGLIVEPAASSTALADMYWRSVENTTDATQAPHLRVHFHTPTPSATPTPTAIDDSVLINEILAWPGEDQEYSGAADPMDNAFIEIYSTESADFDLSTGRLIVEGTGLETQRYYIPYPALIEPDDVKVFYARDIGLSLMHTDTITISLKMWAFSEAEGWYLETLDSVALPAAVEGQSYGRTYNAAPWWGWSSSPSPGY